MSTDSPAFSIIQQHSDTRVNHTGEVFHFVFHKLVVVLVQYTDGWFNPEILKKTTASRTSRDVFKPCMSHNFTWNVCCVSWWVPRCCVCFLMCFVHHFSAPFLQSETLLSPWDAVCVWDDVVLLVKMVMCVQLAAVCGSVPPRLVCSSGGGSDRDHQRRTSAGPEGDQGARQDWSVCALRPDAAQGIRSRLSQCFGVSYCILL